jgi:hypothetical protein
MKSPAMAQQKRLGHSLCGESGSGALKKLNVVDSGGSIPCYVAFIRRESSCWSPIIPAAAFR